MNKKVCNYAVVRFMPFPETGEFACLGVALLCQEIGFFDYRIETRRRSRITNFFPEMKINVLRQGNKVFTQQLAHIRELMQPAPDDRQLQFQFGEIDRAKLFTELVRPRESLFHFGPIATILAEDPGVELDRLFEYYVNRQFAQREEYQVRLMQQALKEDFLRNNIRNYRAKIIEEDAYSFTVPFVRGDVNVSGAMRLINPLNLAQNDTTKIIDHATIWLVRTRRLLKRGIGATNIMFPVKIAEDDKRASVARDCCKGFIEEGVHVAEFDKQRDRIIDFASAG